MTMAAKTSAAPAHHDRRTHLGVGESLARVSRDLEVCYRVDGNERDPAVVLIAGLSQQLQAY